MSATPLMPTIFVAHGSPMNALGGNDHARALAAWGKGLPRPKAIAVISAHWRTRGTQVLRHPRPPMIYDFSGFPPELSAIKYPAPGSLDVADRIVTLLAGTGATPTTEWGYDHGAWSVLCHMFPAADIPVTLIGQDKKARTEDHWQVAQKLAPLRAEGVLILGSGNVTHNLGDLSWEDGAEPMRWAVDFDCYIKESLEARNLDALLRMQGAPAELWRRALPTTEHYMPLIYAMGATDAKDRVAFPYMEMQNGSLSMRCVQFG